MVNTTTSTMVTKTINGVKIVRNPPQSTLAELGVFSWEMWSCDVSKFPWESIYGVTMYFLEGKMKVHVEGSDEEEDFEIGTGDLVEIAKGVKIFFDVTEAVTKHHQHHQHHHSQ